MTENISRSELARWAGVTRAATSKACKLGGPLYDATDAGGVDPAHPLVRQWLSSHGVDELPAPKPTTPGPTPRKRAPRKPKAARDPTPAPDIPEPPRDTPTPVMPYELKDLENMTVRDVVMRFGSVDGFKRFVDSLKSIAEYKHRELRVRQQRGDLVEREKVVGLVFPLIEVAFARLVSDVPDSVSKIVVARCEAGGPETTADVVQLIRDANSRVLKNMKQSAERLEFLNDGN
jgi:hypothetical protein